jgi:hypothetical protein
MDLNGYMFHTMTRDKKSVYQNSGVRVQAVVDDSHDDDEDTETNTYYGQIEEICVKPRIFIENPNPCTLVIVSGSVAIAYRTSHRYIHKVIHRLT